MNLPDHFHMPDKVSLGCKDLKVVYREGSEVCDQVDFIKEQQAYITDAGISCTREVDIQQ